jgi:hypothetical protein
MSLTIVSAIPGNFRSVGSASVSPFQAFANRDFLGEVHPIA